MPQTETEEASEPDQLLDSAALREQNCIVDTWLNNRGKRLYFLIEGISEYSPLFALTTYEREIDPNTGDTVETETIDAVGSIVPTVHFSPSTSQLLDRIIEGASEGIDWNEADVEYLCDTFERKFPQRIQQLINSADPPFADLHLLSDARIPIDQDEESTWFADADGSYEQWRWEQFFWALAEDTTYIDSVYGEDHIDARAVYAFPIEPAIQSAPDWRVQAAEYYRCGTFRNSPSAANVAALMEDEDFPTQKEIASILDRHKSTISQLVADVNDRRQRTQWMCENAW